MGLKETVKAEVLATAEQDRLDGSTWSVEKLIIELLINVGYAFVLATWTCAVRHPCTGLHMPHSTWSFHSDYKPSLVWLPKYSMVNVVRCANLVQAESQITDLRDQHWTERFRTPRCYVMTLYC